MNPREYAALFEVEDRHWWFAGVRREIARELARAAPEGGFRRWLDAGSGTGGLLANLEVPGKPCGIGLDLASEGVLFARQRPGARVGLGSVEMLPFGDESFDLMTSIDVLYHRNVDDARALSEAFRTLAPGGVLIVQVPAFDSLRGEHDTAVWTNRRYRLGEIARLLQSAGFAVRRRYYRNSILFPAAALRRLLRGRSREVGEARSDVGPVSRTADFLFSCVLRFEEALRGAGAWFPFGLSVFSVAQKPTSPVRRPASGPATTPG
ncbi:MAG TPA: class I SAM-dependent methyltransferase [Thermoanaerobaculia bacterium]|nr:class I SAM-dependent methyltransferase [Thermoanaerobaculia bacterium]